MSNCLTKFSIKALSQKSSHSGNAGFERSHCHTLNLQLFERKGQDVFHLSPAFHQLRLSRHFTITLPSRRIEMQPTVFWWINKSVFAVPDSGTEWRVSQSSLVCSWKMESLQVFLKQIWEGFTPWCWKFPDCLPLLQLRHWSEGLVCSTELSSLNPDTLTPPGITGTALTAKTVQMGREWNFV